LSVEALGDLVGNQPDSVIVRSADILHQLYLRKGRTAMMSILARFHREESGQGLVEYVLILALIAFASVTAMQALASNINVAFSMVAALLNDYI
jgi:Flp pilus assembly pilin Flp